MQKNRIMTVTMEIQEKASNRYKDDLTYVLLLWPDFWNCYIRKENYRTMAENGIYGIQILILLESYRSQPERADLIGSPTVREADKEWSFRRRDERAGSTLRSISNKSDPT